ncbi:MFS transporter [Peribacillus sp. NPDC097295]|uniref:MFS transporter n=1 Tax=Peribacillus sp. NPDC097295 TaxID=3364402 RepID=UPI003803ED09
MERALRTYDNRPTNDKSKVGIRAIIIEIIMLFTYAFFAVSWIAGSILTPQIMEHFNIESFSAATLLSNAITIAKIIGNLLAAWFLVNFNPKKAIGFASLLIVVGSISAPFVSQYWMFIILRFVMGFGGALFIVYFGPIVIKYFSPEQRPIINGINNVAYNIGSIIAMLAVLPVYNWLLTWQSSLIFFAAFSGILLILWLIVGEDFNLNKSSNSSLEVNQEIYTFKDGLKDKFNYTFAFTYSGLLTLYIVILSIFPVADFTAIDSALLSATVAFAAIAGSAVGILLTKKINRRLPVLRWSGLFMTAAAFIMILTHSPALSIVMAGVVGFLMFLPITALVTIPQELPNMTPSKLTVIMGFFWSFSYIVETIAYYAIGVVIDLSGFKAGLIVAVVLSLTFFIGSFLLPETGKRKLIKT